MEKDKEITHVVFRVYDEGDIIALFPYQWETFIMCSSYMQAGQHAQAEYHTTMEATRPASIFQYDGLKAELESIGYNLVVIRAANPLHLNRTHRDFSKKYFETVNV